MEPSEIIDWALSHGFRQTGVNAYSAMHEGSEYQMLLRRGGFRLQRLHLGHIVQHHAKCDYAHLRVDERGMLLNAGLGKAFVRMMWRGGTAPIWFTPEFTAYALQTMIPEWEAKIAPPSPR